MTSSISNSAPNEDTCSNILSLNSGPEMALIVGKFSTRGEFEICPPIVSFSMIKTLFLLRSKYIAAVKPLTPPPIIIESNVLFILF